MQPLQRAQRAARLHQRTVIKHFHKRHRHVHRLLKKHDLTIHKIRHHAVRVAAVSSIAASTLVGPAFAQSNQPDEPAVSSEHALQQELIPQGVPAPGSPAGPASDLASTDGLFAVKAARINPNPGPHMTADQEAAMSALIQDSFHISAKAELEGIRLNTAYGVVAGEQHLPLYPGDTIDNHVTDPTRRQTGMVPGLPSWGYFAPNKQSVTQEMRQQEEFYIAAQTFLAPGWQEHTQEYYQWFHGRKMIMVNAVTGRACVVDIQDAGPSPFLKRSFGASNEVLMSLGLGLQRKGAVYAFFVDDPDNKVPLGPVGGGPLE